MNNNSMKAINRESVILAAMPQVRWKLKEFLKEHNLSAYSVAKTSNISLNSIYKLTNNKARTLQLDNLEAIIATLEKKTGKSIELSDILEYDPES